jgi:5-methylcytosine-specific restriction protein A
VECLKQSQWILAEEVDHIIPHRGDEQLMKDPLNLQSLCRSHHSAKTAAEVLHAR